MNIYDLISRAQKLRQETKLDSVSPDRVGALCEDTLKYINEFQLLASSPSLHKIYASVSAMQADKSPKSDLTGKALKPGQLVVIVPANQSDATAGDVYRYDGPSGNTSAWTFVSKIGAVPADAELNATSANPVQNKVVTEKLTELSAETMRVLKGYGASSLVYSESLNDNGTTSSASLTKTSEYIEIPIDATRLYYSLSAGRVLFCLYDANKQLVNAFLTFSSEKKLEEGVVNLNAYSNAKYIRFACWDSLKAECYIHFSNLATSEDVDVVAEELFGQNYNKYDLIYAERLDKNNGNAVSASTIKCSDFLPIPNDAIALYYNLVANDCNICLYDADKTFLESVLVTDSQKLVKGEVRTNGASYFRFNCKIDFMDECYVRFDEVAKKKDLVAVEDKVEVSVEELREDLYNGYYTKQDLIFNEVLDRNGVTVSASTIMTSDYLQIPNGTGVLKYNLCANTVLLCLYDSDKSFIDYIPVSNSSELVEGEINPKDYGASFFRFNCKIALMDKCYVKLLKGNGEQGGGANGEDVALNAKAYGAVGDGITDDTDALEQLFADAYEQQRPIYIPKGTYMIRRSLPIKSNLHIYGEGKNSVIKKFPAIWSKVTKDIAEGDTIIYVESVNGFKVGSQVFITNGTNKAQVAARHCSIGVIEEVNAENNSIRFRSSYDGIKTGAIKSQSKGCYISSSCAILRSWSMFSAAINVRIHDITLDGNRQDGEPMEWFNAPIHFDPDDKGELYGIPYKYSSYNHTIRDCYCINSSYDGISDQGSSHCVIENTTISNCAMHGVHFGTGFYNGKVLNCNIDGNGERGAAIFFCASVKDVIVSNNMITNYYRGASDEEYATEGTDAIIVGNIFDNITDTAFNFVMASEERIGGRHIVANNLLRDIGTLFKGDHIRNVSIANNVIEGVTQSGNPLISITQSEYATIIGNVWNGSMSNVVDLTDTTKVIHANNTWNL